MVYAYKLPVDNPAAWVASAIVKAPQDVRRSRRCWTRASIRTRVAIADIGRP